MGSVMAVNRLKSGRRKSKEKLLVSARAVAFHPTVRTNYFVQFRRGSHEEILRPGFRAKVISVARDFFRSSINRNKNSHTGSIPAPGKGAVFKSEEVCIVEFLEQSMELVFV